MKTSLLFAGLLITTAVGAQMNSAPRTATIARPGQTEVSPTARVDEEAIATDPRIEMLRGEISELKRNQAGQDEEIAHLRHCVAELVLADKSFKPRGPSLATLPQTTDEEPARLAGTLKASSDDDGLNADMSTLAPATRRANLAGCD